MLNEYPATSFHFLVTFTELGFIDPVDVQFQSVSGLEVSFDTETYREGGENRFTYTLPVRTKYPNLILKRGLFKNSELVKWCLDSFKNLEIRPANLVVTLLNEHHLPLMSWNIVQAIPLKWAVSELNAERSELAIETLELSYQYFTIIK